MAFSDCWIANPDWHPGHKKRVLAQGIVVCDECLAQATFGDTWTGDPEVDDDRLKANRTKSGDVEHMHPGRGPLQAFKSDAEVRVQMHNQKVKEAPTP